ncbi:MAG: xanthine dehydrogenase accessory protein PucB, partial [Anaerolineae bacterium]
RETFPELCQLRGAQGGRAIFSRHRLHYLPWHDRAILLDVDTPEDYQRLVMEG